MYQSIISRGNTSLFIGQISYPCPSYFPDGVYPLFSKLRDGTPNVRDQNHQKLEIFSDNGNFKILVKILISIINNIFQYF